MTSLTAPATNLMREPRTTCIHGDLIEAARLVMDVDVSQPVEDLSDAVYRWYVNAIALDTGLPNDTVVPVTNHALAITPAAAFRHAHAGSQRFEPGWAVMALLGWGAISAVSRTGVERIFRAGEFRRHRSNGLPAVGESILGEVAWSWVEAETGFWLTRRGVWEPEGAVALVRVYFNAAPQQACDLIREMTSMLLRDGCSFMLKTPAAAYHGGRADSVVLYLGDADWSRLQMDITTHTQHLVTRDATPRFAARLAPGIAWSMGPLTGESFGKIRADLIAATVHGRSFSSETACVTSLATAFEQAGLSTAHPHLQPAS